VAKRLNWDRSKRQKQMRSHGVVHPNISRECADTKRFTEGQKSIPYDEVKQRLLSRMLPN
jgi:uncharacterized DUF497 family protein